MIPQLGEFVNWVEIALSKRRNSNQPLGFGKQLRQMRRLYP